MKIIKLSQREDREAWLDLRRGKIGGSDAKGVKPLSRGLDRTPAGLWDLLAQKLCVAKDGEPEMDRGLRLEQEALHKTIETIGKPLDLDPGMWLSDLDEDISVSPDSAEPGNKPTYSAEAKCLDSKNHLKYIVTDMRLKKLSGSDYKGILGIPAEFKEQVIQYFAVNEYLQTMYFTLYDDRQALEGLMHYVITVTRDEVADLITGQVEYEQDTLKQIRELIKELKSYVRQ
jgi:hypothetical protein